MADSTHNEVGHPRIFGMCLKVALAGLDQGELVELYKYPGVTSTYGSLSPLTSGLSCWAALSRGGVSISRACAKGNWKEMN